MLLGYQPRYLRFVSADKRKEKTDTCRNTGTKRKWDRVDDPLTHLEDTQSHK